MKLNKKTKGGFLITNKGCEEEEINVEQARQLLIIIKDFLNQQLKQNKNYFKMISIKTNLKELIEYKMNLKQTTTYQLLETIKEKSGHSINSFYFVNSKEQCTVAHIIKSLDKLNEEK